MNFYKHGYVNVKAKVNKINFPPVFANSLYFCRLFSPKCNWVFSLDNFAKLYNCWCCVFILILNQTEKSYFYCLLCYSVKLLVKLVIISINDTTSNNKEISAYMGIWKYISWYLCIVHKFRAMFLKMGYIPLKYVFRWPGSITSTK